MKIVVTGAGGFIGSHLVARLSSLGHSVTGIDIKTPEFMESAASEFLISDLRNPTDIMMRAVAEAEIVYALAADIGGMGHISKNEFDILSNNALIDTNTFKMCAESGVRRVIYASSACVYPRHLQAHTHSEKLAESAAWPADPDGAYGFEKLFGEVALDHLSRQFGITVVAARFHNVYGPMGTYDGGREKAPAALCRKVVAASAGGVLEVWGDGSQERSFCYVDDCVEALLRLLLSEFSGPINIGSEHQVTVAELAELIISVSGRDDLTLQFVDGPIGVRSRNSDSSLAARILGWRPAVSLEEGIGKTYEWIRQQIESTQPSVA